MVRTMIKMAGIILVVMMLALSCSTRYTSDPIDEFDEPADEFIQEEVREIYGLFWSTGYGNYFEPYDSGELWCTYGGGLSPRYDRTIEEAEEEYGPRRVRMGVEVVLSGFVGDYLDLRFDPDCDRILHVTILHDMWPIVLEVPPTDRHVPPGKREKKK